MHTRIDSQSGSLADRNTRNWTTKQTIIIRNVCSIVVRATCVCMCVCVAKGMPYISGLKVWFIRNKTHAIEQINSLKTFLRTINSDLKCKWPNWIHPNWEKAKFKRKTKSSESNLFHLERKKNYKAWSQVLTFANGFW